eukprot:2300885-Amphidinium_carterae.1
MKYLHVQQLQSDGELKIHEESTENNSSDLMTKYLETAKIKKHSETIGLHPYLGNRSINVISSNGSRGPITTGRKPIIKTKTKRNYTTAETTRVII